MYIKKIELDNVRCFDHVEIDLSDCKKGTSILIAGNNGIGKSSILRAIAMGLCDRDSSASLLRELEGNFIRKDATKSGSRGRKRAHITIELQGRSNQIWKIKTSVTEWQKLIIERVDQEYLPPNGRSYTEDFDSFSNFWENLFVVGYGAGLRTTATAKFSDYFTPDAVYSLFKYDAPLQDPEMAWRRLRAASKNPKNKTTPQEVDVMVKNILAHVLDINRNDVNLYPNGIYISDGHKAIALDSLGDGHQSIIKIALDILLWYLLNINYDINDEGESRKWKAVPLDEKGSPVIRGIVIIDEVEQHLHPKLQRQVIKRLQDKFPYVQFILTTHSPLCVSGTADVRKNGNDTYKVYSLMRDSQQDKVDLVPKNTPKGLRADQILVDYFELSSTLNVTLETIVDEYRTLTAIEFDRKLTSKEKKRLGEVIRLIEKESIAVSEREDDRRIERELLKEIQR
ncbi:MAG: hypothetical protein PsegKO_33250 [Pseudohongiellaceae bacterium]